MRDALLCFAAAALCLCQADGQQVMVECEAFADKGGWVVDQQFMDQMGSPFLLAHGIGKPVADASTKVKIPVKGTYRVFARARNWTAPWSKAAAGRFTVLVNGSALQNELGKGGTEWVWP